MIFRWLSLKRESDYDGPERRKMEPNYGLFKWLLTIGFVSGIIYNRYWGDHATIEQLVVDSKNHDVSIAAMDAKLDYMKDGIDRILDELHR